MINLIIHINLLALIVIRESIVWVSESVTFICIRDTGASKIVAHSTPPLHSCQNMKGLQRGSRVALNLNIRFLNFIYYGNVELKRNIYDMFSNKSIYIYPSFEKNLFLIIKTLTKLIIYCKYLSALSQDLVSKKCSERNVFSANLWEWSPQILMKEMGGNLFFPQLREKKVLRGYFPEPFH